MNRTTTMKSIMKIAASALLALALVPANASAFRVYSPNVTPDETAIGFWGEATGEGGTGAGKKPESKRAQIELRHTFYDRLDLGAAAVAESGASGNGGEDIGYSRFKLRAVMQVTEKKAHFVDFGVYMDYQLMNSAIRSTIPDYLNIFLLFEKDFDAWHMTVNPGIRKNMSIVAGTQDNVAEYQAEAKYHLDPLFNPGVQAYGINLGEWTKFSAAGDQLHYAGPAFDGSLPEVGGFTVHYEGALLFGLSPASYNVLANGVLEIRF
ncbi:MAG: hypothetical protein HZA03_07515 [Nitrospinae bacterium]|nr:hypothetical protein [Nitrospinota bacterium]